MGVLAAAILLIMALDAKLGEVTSGDSRPEIHYKDTSGAEIKSGKPSDQVE
jgi:hypothetical protein